MTCFSTSPGHEPDQVDLDQRVLDEQAGGADRRSCGWHLEIFLPHLVESKEVVEVGEKYPRLEDIVERAAGGLEGPFQVLEDEAGLQLDIGAVERKAGKLAEPLRVRRS